MSRRTRDERGVSSVELVLYMPILMTIILVAVQFTLYYFGRQTASAVARETARVVRVTGDVQEARNVGREFAGQIGRGVLEDRTIQIALVAGESRVRVTVEGQAQQILPRWVVPRVSESVEGPVERFVGGS